ncbi:UNKNOWN [Stylonychia lemnae]|uniref:Uncharacterized protein n=1 Tax=Stylonychia lemnae TaxID=5949 RepID=A0A078BAA8_STYLE|nr:UNKNOWN [Stylonychia lemnae]|eukprot:CDW90448.1 UNKNOWN [Stylonychia lemnae]
MEQSFLNLVQAQINYKASKSPDLTTLRHQRKIQPNAKYGVDLNLTNVSPAQKNEGLIITNTPALNSNKGKNFSTGRDLNRIPKRNIKKPQGDISFNPITIVSQINNSNNNNCTGAQTEQQRSKIDMTIPIFRSPIIRKNSIYQPQPSIEDYQSRNNMKDQEFNDRGEQSSIQSSGGGHVSAMTNNTGGNMHKPNMKAGDQGLNYFFPDVNLKNRDQTRKQSGNIKAQSPLYLHHHIQNDESVVLNKSGFESHGANLTTNASLTSNNIYEFNKSPYVINKNKSNLHRREMYYDRNKINSNINENQNALSINQSSNLSHDSNTSPSLQTTRTALLKLKESMTSNNQQNNGFQDNQQSNQILPQQLKILEKYKFKMPQDKQIQQYMDNQKIPQNNSFNIHQLLMYLGKLQMNSPSSKKDINFPTNNSNNKSIIQMSSIATYLDQTLSKLKGRKPNQRNLKPLDNQVLLRFQEQLASQMKNFQNKNRDHSPDEAITENQQALSTSKVLDLQNEVNFDDLTQEDRFYLIKQLEDIQQNIRYQLDGSPYIFQDFDDDGQYAAEEYYSENDISPLQSFKVGESFNKTIKDQHRKQLEIIKDEEEDEEDKESVIKINIKVDPTLNYSGETFDQRSPTQKKYRQQDMQENYLGNIQSQGQLRKILNERKIKKSISLVDINDEDDEIIIADNYNMKGDQSQNISEIPKQELENLKNAIIEPDDLRSRNNQIPLFTDTQQSRVIIMSNRNTSGLKNDSQMLNHNYLLQQVAAQNISTFGKQASFVNVNPKIFQFNQIHGRLSPMIRHEIQDRKISEEEESQVLFQSKILNTFERSPRDSKIYHAQNDARQQ